ncbi:MAG: hypothetical protein DIZ78_15935 [endosymbiont of Escarpia spicata]|uniref:Uncharacterized protein n=1 Tax=endosymbiont of Escarpia spicata TaxID=2200908 RepID=A0A370DAK4_9GAMM|nr:MAG: hypothetical protein DIZ78_15935 [endosymbiont of Escarpia spicata]
MKHIIIIAVILNLAGCGYKALKPETLNVNVAGNQLSASNIVTANYCEGGILLPGHTEFHSQKCFIVETKDRFIFLRRKGEEVSNTKPPLGELKYTQIQSIGMWKSGVGRQLHIRIPTGDTFVLQFQLMKSAAFINTEAMDSLYKNLKSKGYPEFEVTEITLPVTDLPFFIFLPIII